jgi:hypothetical protein
MPKWADPPIIESYDPTIFGFSQKRKRTVFFSIRNPPLRYPRLPKEVSMKERITQVLLALIAVLLALNLFQPASLIPSAPAQTQQLPEVIRAQAFHLVNSQGHAVVQLYAGEDGSGNIRLRSGDGVVRVKLGADTGGSGLLLLDKETEPAVWLLTGKDGTSLTLAEKGKEKKILRP